MRTASLFLTVLMFGLGWSASGQSLQCGISAQLDKGSVVSNGLLTCLGDNGRALPAEPVRLIFGDLKTGANGLTKVAGVFSTSSRGDLFGQYRMSLDNSANVWRAVNPAGNAMEIKFSQPLNVSSVAIVPLDARLIMAGCYTHGAHRTCEDREGPYNYYGYDNFGGDHSEHYRHYDYDEYSSHSHTNPPPPIAAYPPPGPVPYGAPYATPYATPYAAPYVGPQYYGGYAPQPMPAPYGYGPRDPYEHFGDRDHHRGPHHR